MAMIVSEGVKPARSNLVRTALKIVGIAIYLSENELIFEIGIVDVLL